jgi:hypothetical protein
MQQEGDPMTYHVLNPKSHKSPQLTDVLHFNQPPPDFPQTHTPAKLIYNTESYALVGLCRAIMSVDDVIVLMFVRPWANGRQTAGRILLKEWVLKLPVH